MFSSQNSQVSSDANYIEDVFQTWLYTGNGSTQTITNGIDLSTKGGLVWLKVRNQGARDHWLQDTARGITNTLNSNTTGAQNALSSNIVSSVTTTGFVDNASWPSGWDVASWTFRKQPKFFDIVTYSGNSTAGRTVAHNLGSVPGCMIVRDLLGGPWYVYHQALGNTQTLVLNSSTNAGTDPSWNNTTPTSTVFTLGDNYQVNYTGHDYVAYLFAHNAGGFGLTGTDNVISCGSFTTNGSSVASITLGYEPQWVMTKRTDSTGPWGLYDNMRGWSLTAQNYLLANDSGAEGVINATGFAPNATGFTTSSPFDASATYIYIAIRRGPMAVPTSGTSVFSPVAYTGNGAGASGQTITAGFPIDLASYRYTNQPYGGTITDRLRGFTGTSSKALYTYATSAEATDTEIYGGDSNTSIKSYGFSASYNFVGWYWRRAPSFMDVVCYTGNGTAGRTVNHNLGVAPELMIVKRRNSSSDASWIVYAASQGISAGGQLNSNAAFGSMLGYYQWNNTAPTASVFTLGDGATDVNNAAGTYVWYGFATCPGVSKVGSYTGTGTTKQVDCGFTGGARFVLIKRTDSTGDWYVWDSARGIVAGNDPYILLNNDLAQVTSTDYIDTYSAGFEISSTAPAAINASGGTFIFLAIA